MGKTRRLKSQIRNLPQTFPPPVFHRFAIFDEDTISGCRTSASNPQVGYDEGSNESIFAGFVVPEEKILEFVMQGICGMIKAASQNQSMVGFIFSY